MPRSPRTPRVRASGAGTRWLRTATLLLVAVAGCSTGGDDTLVDWDLVILNGRVMDPETGLDALRAIGVRNGVIGALAEGTLTGRDTIDADGFVVAPGFIDLHQHAQDGAAYAVAARDGSTSVLELEGGTADVDAWYAARAGRSLIHHGVSVGHERVRMDVMHDPGTVAAVADAKLRAATETELQAIAAAIDTGLARGAVGVGMLIEFTPAATPWEIFTMFQHAAAQGATVFVHLRSLDEPLYFLETEEVIAAVAASGGSAHVVHIQSSGGEDTPRMLDMIDGARARGLDITAEVYPYTASMSPIEGAEFDDWASWPDTKFARFEWPATGERLTRTTFAKYRAQGGMLVDFNNPEVVVAASVADPRTTIASDGILEAGVGHPRVAGTFARVLGHYVRETRALTLMDALRKMTLAPALRLQARVPAMAAKGRVQVGADADLVIFDPATVLDQATYREPALPPLGIRDVLVSGVPVVRGGVTQDGVLPGKPLRAPVR